MTYTSYLRVLSTLTFPQNGNDGVWACMEMQSALKQLTSEDLGLLLRVRGLETGGEREELIGKLGEQLSTEQRGKWLWEKLPSLPQGRWMCSAISRGNDVYVFGGVFQGPKLCQEMLCWKPGQQEWTLVAPSTNVPDLYCHTAVLYQDEMWVFGPTRMNREDGNRAFQIWSYNFESQQWWQTVYQGAMPFIPVQTADMYSTILVQDQVFFFTSQGVYTYNFSTQTIGCCTPAAQDGQHNVWWQTYQATFHEGKMVLAGWGDPGGSEQQHGQECGLTMWYLDPKKQKWQFLNSQGNKPAALNKFRAVQIKNMWIFFGGSLVSNFSSSNNTAVTHVCNLKTMTWSQLSDQQMLSIQPPCRSCYGVTCLNDDTAVFVGGYFNCSAISPTPSTSVDCLRLIDQPKYFNNHQKNSFGNDNFIDVSISPMLGSIQTNVNLSYLFGNHHLSDVILQVKNQDDHSFQNVNTYANQNNNISGENNSNSVNNATQKQNIYDKNNYVQIPAHKIVLSMHSNYFRHMWQMRDMQENQTNIVSIDDVDLDVVYIMLKYSYGCLEYIPLDQVGDVFSAADRFDMQALRNVCVNIMCEHIDPNNVLQLWQLSKEYQLSALEILCLDKIFVYFNEGALPNFFELDDENIDKEIRQWIQLRKDGLHPLMYKQNL